LTPLPADLSFNTSISFVTNTNWPELRRPEDDDESSHADSASLVHNFLSAANRPRDGVCAGAAFARSSDHGRQFLGRCQSHRSYVLLPISIVIALAFVALGVPQTLAGSDRPVTTLEGCQQTISIGRWQARKPSRSSAPTGRVHVRQFRRTRSKTQRLDQHHSDLGLAAHPVASGSRFGRAIGDFRQAARS